MTQNISLVGTDVVLNGHKIEGWAAASDALSLPRLKQQEHETGPDGLRVRSRTGERGGIVTFKLQANSPSSAWFGAHVAAQLNGANTVFSGSISYPNGLTIRLERGALDENPLGVSLGNAAPGMMEYSIDFESIVPNYNAVQTTTPPVWSELQ